MQATEFRMLRSLAPKSRGQVVVEAKLDFNRYGVSLLLILIVSPFTGVDILLQSSTHSSV